MKILKKYNKAYYVIIAMIFAAAALAYAFVPTALVHIAYYNWLAVAIAAIILISPWGSIKIRNPKRIEQKKKRGKKAETLADEPEKQPLNHWLTKIVIFEATLFVLYYVICQFNAVVLPTQTQPHPEAFGSTLYAFLTQYGLFPWSFIAILAIGFAITSFNKQKDCYSNTLCDALPMLKNKLFSVALQTAGRMLSQFALGFTAVVVTFVFASIISSVSGLHSIAGFTGGAIGATLLMLFLCYRRSSSHLLQSIVKQRPAFSIFLILMIWAIALGVISLILDHIGSPKQVIPGIVTSIVNRGWMLHWHIISTGWWISLIPISAIYIARQSYGYSLRAIILATAALPLVIAAIATGLHYSSLAHFATPTWLVQAAAVVGMIMLLTLVANKNILSNISQCYLGKSATGKHRSEDIFVSRWKKMCGVLFYFYIPAGIYVTSLIFLLPVIMGGLLTTLAAISLVIQLAKKSHQANKNQTEALPDAHPN